jgi:predicted chitinase
MTNVDLTRLSSLMPSLSIKTAVAYITPINKAMVENSIDTPQRVAAFLAQLAHESNCLRFWEEIASGAAYEGRVDLGNTQPGDGRRYKGRGPIQITGRANYRRAGAALGIDLEENPGQASTVKVGFQVAAWFWSSSGLNSLADEDTESSFRKITRRINGGYNGWEDRLRYWKLARTAYNLPTL